MADVDLHEAVAGKPRMDAVMYTPYSHKVRLS
jgi:hypothetical protein